MSRLIRSVNAHIHLPPNFSAFESAAQAVALAANQGIRILGASNYYDYSVYADFTDLCRRQGIFPLYGIEIIALLEDVQRAGVRINDPGNPGKMYLCGKGITRYSRMTPEAERLLGLVRRRDEARMRGMIGRISGCFAEAGVPAELDEQTVIEGIVQRHGVRRDIVVIQERHVAQAFQEELFRLVPAGLRKNALERILRVAPRGDVEDPIRAQNEIRTHLMKTGKPAFVEERFLSLDESIRLVLELGGIPCYPTLADGADPICEYEDPPGRLIETLLGHGIYCAEFIPLRNRLDVLETYVLAFRNAGFVVTAGTEHNTLDLVPLEPACAGGVAIPPGVKDIFAEGACVAAAHQFLNLQGSCGYVDSCGNLNPGFADGEERIRYFCRLGAEIVSQEITPRPA
jgi:hypothetical protein